MSPLRSSSSPNSIIPSNSNRSYSSRIHTLQHCESDSYLSDKDYEAPQHKKSRFKTNKQPRQSSPSHIYIPSNTSNSYSSDKEHEPEATTSTSQTKGKRQPVTTKKKALSQDQIHALKSATISLQEFINIYHDTPIKLRDKKFYTICRSYLHKLSKTKTTLEDKKAMFLSLPRPLTTSIPLFKLIFETESIILLDIIAGKTDPTRLLQDVDKLMQFFHPAYLKRQIYRYVKHKQPLLNEDKSIVSSCMKKLNKINKKYTTAEIQTNKTLLEDEHHSSDEEKKPPKHTKKLDPEAKIILNALSNGTIETKEIIPSRQKLILLNVDRRLIRESIRKFRRIMELSHREDKHQVLQAIKESGQQAVRIKSYSKTRKRSSSESTDSFVKEHSTHTGIIQSYLHPQAQPILQSLNDCSIKTKDIVKAREQLISIVDRGTIKNVFRTFKNKIIQSDRLDKQQILAEIDKSGKKTNLIKGKTQPLSNRLTELLLSASHGSILLKDIRELRDLMFYEYTSTQASSKLYKIKASLIKKRPQEAFIIKKAFRDAIRNTVQQPSNKLNQLLELSSKGTILLQDIKVLRELLFQEYDSAKASSKLYNIKAELIKKRPQETDAIKQAFYASVPTKRKESEQSKNLKAAVKSGDLKVQEFTRLYNSVTSAVERSYLNKTIVIYIHHLSQQTPQLQDKLATFRLLPKNLQTSASTINSFFPQQHEKISLIRSGQIASKELKETCLKLLDVISIRHVRRLLSKYVNNRQTMTIEDKQQVSECRKILFDMQKSKQDQSDSDIGETQYEEYGQELSTITSQPTKLPTPTTHNQATTSAKYETYQEKQGIFKTQSNNKYVSLSPDTSTFIKHTVDEYTHHTNSWHTSEQPISCETQVNILNKHTVPKQQTSPTVTEKYIVTNTQESAFLCPTSPQPSTSHSIEYRYKSVGTPIVPEQQSQPSTSYSVENITETVKPLLLEQISTNELTCILQSIVNEDEGSEDQIMLQNYLLQLAQDLQQEPPDIEQIAPQKEEGPTFTAQSITHTKTINTHTDEQIPDEESTVPEEFLYITEMTRDLSNEEINELTDTIEATLPLQNTNLEEFLDCMDIDN